MEVEVDDSILSWKEEFDLREEFDMNEERFLPEAHEKHKWNHADKEPVIHHQSQGE